MTEPQTVSSDGVLVDVEQLIRSEACFQANGFSPVICITDNYRYSSNEELQAGTREALASLIAKTQAEGFLLPKDNGLFSIVPVRGSLRAVMEKASSAMAWSDARSLVPASDLQRLLTHGVLGFKLSRGVLSGPAAQVLLTSIENGSVLNALKTDSLSWAALCHAARLPLTDPAALMFRLYSYNSAPLFKAKRLEDAVQQVRQIVEKDWQGTFRVRTPSPDNPGWYLFGNARKESRAQQVPHKAKVYLSPVVADVGRCLAQVVKILPSVDFEAWKIGRCSYGITRPDKICVYFASIEHAQVAAEVFARELNGIEPQGVPFTTRYDPSGLISIGVDPQPPGAAPRYAIPNSWRLWVSRKMASALAIAKATPNYPLSPEQAALWTVRFLGISPESWTIRDDNFWRN